MLPKWFIILLWRNLMLSSLRYTAVEFLCVELLCDSSDSNLNPGSFCPSYFKQDENRYLKQTKNKTRRWEDGY